MRALNKWLDEPVRAGYVLGWAALLGIAAIFGTAFWFGTDEPLLWIETAFALSMMVATVVLWDEWRIRHLAYVLVMLGLLDVGRGFVFYKGSLITNYGTGGDMICYWVPPPKHPLGGMVDGEPLMPVCPFQLVPPLGKATITIYRKEGVCFGNAVLLVQLRLYSLAQAEVKSCGHTWTFM